jgi:outer membrane receptor protein involved in Fe transport
MCPNLLFQRRVIGALVVVVLFALLQAESATAAEILEEIIVTADFRGRSASELPGAITLLDSEAIEQAAVQHFEELVLNIPNFNWSGDGNRARYFQIRGVGELEQYEGAPNPSVGFLIDDIDFSGIGSIATLFDVQQIEVLRGPQGTRYGANALAGLVYVQSAEPTDDWSGNIRLGVADDETFSGGVAIGGPISSSGATSFRVSAHHYQGNGFRHNAFLGREDTNGREETTIRGKLLWEPHNDWTVKLTAMYTEIDDGYDAFAVDNSFTVLSDRPGRDAQQSIGSSLKAEWDGSDRFSLTSITAFAESDIDFSFDADWGNPDAWAPFIYDFISINDRERSTLSQEFRLASGDTGRLFNDSTDWLAGVYLMKLTDDLNTINQGSYFDPFFDFAFDLDESFMSDYEATNVAVFGQLDFDVGDAGRISAGIRLEDRSTDYVGIRLEDRSTDYADSAGMSLSPGETMAGGELTYSHGFSDALTGFVSLSKGYKAGGFNLGPVPDDRLLFEQESLWNLEAGIKSYWLDNTLNFNGSVFYSKRRDQQVRTSFQLVPNDPASFVFFTDNAAKGRTVGIEADFRWQVSDAWQIYANLGLLKAEFEDFSTPQVNLSGRRQAHAPAYTAALGGVYRHPGGFFARLDYLARDEFYFDVSHDQQSMATEIVNARLGYDTEGWSAQIWARNLFDEHYPVRGFYFGNEPPDFPDTLYLRFGDPRQIGITFDMRF